ncbi:MAG TPA: cobalamin-binding protein [Edaphobacter sp.]|jgi:iron complex transport system substrate-binding protein|nr:cobalamin-binding protein [Edaphobacter sp.]
MKRLLSALCLVMLASHCFASRTLTDEMGRKVVVPDHPHRVICLMPTVTDIVFTLGAGDDVVAISDYTRYPAAALTKPSVGDLIKPSIEMILSLHPDLVIGVQPAGAMEITDQLERVRIPVFLISPHGLAGIYHSVETIGMALNRTPQADALVRSLQQRVDAVKTRTKGLPRPSVFMPVWYDPITTIGKNAFITEIIEAAGGRSVTDDLPAEWPTISMEVVLERDPDALLLVRGGKTTLQILENRPGWNSMKAIKQRRAYYVDDRINFASPIAIDALEDLARQFHP